MRILFGIFNDFTQDLPRNQTQMRRALSARAGFTADARQPFSHVTGLNRMTFISEDDPWTSFLITQPT